MKTYFLIDGTNNNKVVNDLQLALEIEPNQISIVQQAQSILNGG